MNAARVTAASFGRVLALVFAIVACGACTTPATSVVVIIDTDAPGRVLGMTATVWRGTTMTSSPQHHDWTADASVLSFPASFAVTPGNGAHDGAVTLQLELRVAPDIVGGPYLTIQRLVRFTFQSHIASVVRVYLSTTCAAAVTAPFQCTNTSVPCTMGEYCEEMNPPQTCGNEGQCVPIETVATPVGMHVVDESAMSHGTHGAFFECAALTDCAPNTVCVDNGGDGHFFCKPLCTTDADCDGFGYAHVRCYPEYRLDGTVFQHHVCNDSPGSLHP